MSKPFNVKFEHGDHDFERAFDPAKDFFIKNPMRHPFAKPGVLLPVGKEILLPGFFSAEIGRFEMWGPATLNPAGALAWSFWMTATWAAFKSAPELLPYIAQLKPSDEWRLGRVVRPGMAS